MIGLPGLAALSVYAFLLGVAAPRLLRDARWVVRAPRLAIAMWQALSAGWMVALLLLGLTLARPLLERAAWPQYAAPDSGSIAVITTSVGFAFASALAARVGYVLVRELAWARRERRHHARELALAGRPADALDATILEHPTPAVYCLPTSDGRGTVVISSAARHLLNDQQLSAVIAHERGHLRLHHHHVTAIAGALKLAFPGVPLLEQANREIQALAEMAADDYARRHHSAEALAAALLAVATARTPQPALGAAGDRVTSRLERMLGPTKPLPGTRRIATAAATAGVIMLPIGIACTTVFATATAVTGPLLS